MTPAKLMLNREIAIKLPEVLEPEKGIVPEERYKRYQEKLRTYADKKRRAQYHDLVLGDVEFVATLTQGKLTPNFSGNVDYGGTCNLAGGRTLCKTTESQERH